MTAPERVLIEEAHVITGLPERTLQSLSARGQIWGAAKLGRRWTYDRQRLRAWVLANEAANENRLTSIRETVFSTPASLSAGPSIDDRLKRAIAERLRGV